MAGVKPNRGGAPSDKKYPVTDLQIVNMLTYLPDDMDPEVVAAVRDAALRGNALASAIGKPMNPPPGYTLVDSKSFAKMAELMTHEQMQALCLWEGQRERDEYVHGEVK